MWLISVDGVLVKEGAQMTEAEDAIEDYCLDEAVNLDFNNFITIYKNTDISSQVKEDCAADFKKMYHKKYELKHNFYTVNNYEKYKVELVCAKTKISLTKCVGNTISLTEAKKIKDTFFPPSHPEKKSLSYLSQMKSAFFSRENKCKTVAYASLAVGAVVATGCAYLMKNSR